MSYRSSSRLLARRQFCVAAVRVGTATPAAGGLVDATTSTGTAGTTSARPTTTKTGAGGNIDFEAEVGDCVRLGGTTDDAEIDHADCGSAQSNYKIISKEASSTDCISDADSYYYETLDGVEQGALCLDVDWVVGGCMDLSGEDPRASTAPPPRPTACGLSRSSRTKPTSTTARPPAGSSTTCAGSLSAPRICSATWDF